MVLWRPFTDTAMLHSQNLDQFNFQPILIKKKNYYQTIGNMSYDELEKYMTISLMTKNMPFIF